MSGTALNLSVLCLDFDAHRIVCWRYAGNRIKMDRMACARLQNKRHRVSAANEHPLVRIGALPAKRDTKKSGRTLVTQVDNSGVDRRNRNRAWAGNGLRSRVINRNCQSNATSPEQVDTKNRTNRTNSLKYYVPETH